jgi:uncharacterized protein DUF5655
LGLDRAAQRPLWTCPRCGRQFRARNTYHSCGQYSIEQHFAGRDAVVRDLYDRLLDTLGQFGPVKAYPVKTRIVFQADTPFAAAVPRKHWLDLYVWLHRWATHPRLHHVEKHIFRDFGHVFRLARRAELDPDLIALLREAYAIGSGALDGRP